MKSQSNLTELYEEWERNEDGSLDKVMADYTANPHRDTAEQPTEETVE